MLTIIIVVAIVGCLISLFWAVDEMEGWGYAVSFVCFVAFVWAGVCWVNKGDDIRAELLKRDNIFFLSEEPDKDLYRFLPKFKKRTIVVDGGRDVDYYEIIGD